MDRSQDSPRCWGWCSYQLHDQDSLPWPHVACLCSVNVFAQRSELCLVGSPQGCGKMVMHDPGAGTGRR